MEAVAQHTHSHHRSTNHSPIFRVPRFIDVPYLVPILILLLVKKKFPALSCFFLPQIKAVAHMCTVPEPRMNQVVTCYNPQFLKHTDCGPSGPCVKNHIPSFPKRDIHWPYCRCLFFREQNIALPRHGNIVSEANGRTDLVNKYFNLENVLLKQ